MKNHLNLKYLPKKFTSINFLLFLGLVFALFQGRKRDFFKIEQINTLLPEFYSHISNFCLSYMLYVGIGYFWLLSGLRFIYIIFLGVAFILGNFIYEFFIDVLNTRDIVDAYYGFVGTLLGFLFLLLCKKYGLKPIQHE